MEAIGVARPHVGVVCSLQELGPGKVRLILDDVSNSSESISGNWTHNVLFTCKDYAARDIDELSLSEREFADFGHAILARLVAFRKHPPKDCSTT